MKRLLIVSVFLLVLSSLFLVYVQQTARKHFILLENAQAEEKRLLREWERLRYEQSVLTRSSRVMHAAKTLNMHLPQQNDTIYIFLP